MTTVLQAVNESGADGTTVFLDQASPAKTITTVGNAQWDTAQAPSGLTSSLLLDGTGDYLSLADSADWDFGTGNFTVELFIRFTSTAGFIAIVSNYESSSAGWTLQLTNGTSLRFYPDGDPGPAVFAWTPSTNTWYHVAVSRSGTSIRAFVDGTQIGATETLSTDISGSTAVLAIGRLGGLNLQYVTGWIAAVRVNKGEALYTANFTPPSLPLASGSATPIPVFMNQYRQRWS